MGNICIIGPRSSGKTTYLAGLSCYSTHRGSNQKYDIQPLNEESRKLKQNANNTIKQGLSVEPTIIGDRIQTVDDLDYYSFRITVKIGRFKPPTSIQINLRDYPGEVFEKILHASESDPLHEGFINECFIPDVKGCLLLFTEWESSNDEFYSLLMGRLIAIMDEHDRLKNYRLAVAMSKCERGEIWPGRLDPETDLFGVYLKKTLRTLRDSIPPRNLKFYAISTFGVLDRYDPRPNRTDAFGSEGRASSLREPDRWKPYNLIEPLCWLNEIHK